MNRKIQIMKLTHVHGNVANNKKKTIFPDIPEE